MLMSQRAAGNHHNGKGLQERFISVRENTLKICTNLERDDYMVQSTVDTSPPKWHLAHTTWFFDRFILRDFLKANHPVDLVYDRIFNSYYHSLGTFLDKSKRMMLSRPSLEEVLKYRKITEERILDVMEKHDGELHNLVEIGINHEQQHQELLIMDIKENMFNSPYRPSFSTKRPSGGKVSPLTWQNFEGGLVDIGHDGNGFSFDNELPRHKEYLQPYRISRRLVTNGEYIEFIHDRGYSRPELWLSEGWDAVKAHGWRMPHYWVENMDGFSFFTPNGMERVRPEEPVCHVSFFEADAFARWKGCSLPSEFQWENAMISSSHDDGNFFDDGTYHPAVQQGDILHGPGGCWEWTASSYAPYPGYKPLEGAVGEYNGKFMSGKMVLRGASAATPKDHARLTYRNFYHPESRWQYSGFRLAEVL